MRYMNKGRIVRLSCDILQNGYCSKAGTIGMITAIENGKTEICTEEYRFICCTKQELQLQCLPSYEAAQKILEKYTGHHCPSYDSFQFNIKLYNYHIPQLVTDSCSEQAVWDRYYELLNQNLEDFMGHSCDYGLNYIIPWVGNKVESNWFQAGRSGSWLVLKSGIDHQSLADDIEFTHQRMSDLHDIYDSAEDGEEIIDIINEFKNLARFIKDTRYELRTLATQIDFITKLLESGKKALSKYLSGIEPWKNLLIDSILENKRHEFKEFEEREELGMPDIKPLKGNFEQKVENVQQLTDFYCSTAYRLLQKNKNSYTLLVLWEDRITSAIHEREALLKSSKKLLTQLGEDIDALNLLRQEIQIKLNRQEKSEVA